MPTSVQLPPPPDLSQTLRYFRSRGMFCDVRLRVAASQDAEGAAPETHGAANESSGAEARPDVEMVAHRVVLAAVSPYFADHTTEEIYMPPEMTGKR